MESSANLTPDIVANLLSEDVPSDVLQQINQPEPITPTQTGTISADISNITNSALQTIKTNKHVKVGLYVAGGVIAIMLLSGACYVLYTEHQKQQRQRILNDIEKKRKEKQSYGQQPVTEDLFKETTYGVL